MTKRVIGRLLIIVVTISTSAVSADDSNKRPELKLGFDGWTVQGDKIERTQRADGVAVIKITGNVLLWTLNLNGKATVASMDYLEYADSSLILKGYPVMSAGEGMMASTPHMDPEFPLTVKDGKITSQHQAEFSGSFDKSDHERVAAIEKKINLRKEVVYLKLAEISKP
jgi:hypothetical protein